MRICGLLGRNIQYSKSPEIHNNFYLENNLDLKYELFDIGEEKIDDFIKNLKKNNIIGFNVTIPYKETILKYLNKLEYPANIIGAVNTVLVKGNELIGYNTDYFGFIESLKLNQIEVKEKSVLILGSGGAAKAVYHAVKDLEAKDIDVAGRNIQKIEKDFMLAHNIFNIKNDIDLHKYDMIINCTPLGNINNDIMPINLVNFNKNLLIYDLNYLPNKSKILYKGEKYGLRIINGETMLKCQAYYSINLWTSKG